jgi:hypothetical protein
MRRPDALGLIVCWIAHHPALSDRAGLFSRLAALG